MIIIFIYAFHFLLGYCKKEEHHTADFIQRAFFPKDGTLFNIMRSDELKKLLATDAYTIEGQNFIAGYYGINNWVQLEEKGEQMD